MNFSRWFYLALFGLAVYWFAGSYIFPPVTAHPAPPAHPETLSDAALCESWRAWKSDALTKELRTRHILLAADWPDAANGLPRVGMSRWAVYCVLGMPTKSTEFAAANLSWTVQVYRRANASPVVVHIERGMVASFSY